MRATGPQVRDEVGLGEPGLVGVRAVPSRTPTELLHTALVRGLNPTVYWEDADEAVIGLGVAEEIVTEGSDRFRRADVALLERLTPEIDGARWFGGFAYEDTVSGSFRDHRSLRFFRPQLLWRQGRDGRALLGAAANTPRPLFERALEWASDEISDAVTPGRRGAVVATPEPRARWTRAVEDGLSAIREGSVRKVVMSRRIDLRSEAAFQPAQVLAGLPARSGTEAAFAFFAGASCFLGLTPERLLRVSPDGRLETEALAGTSTPEDPDGFDLLESLKDRDEHQHVVEHIVTRLGPLAATVAAASEPSVRRLGHIAHLCTPIYASGVDGRQLLGLAGQLHPTPAVGGVPPREAAKVIARVEGRDRGWYAGGVGWVAPQRKGAGRCELRVALRTALLEGHTARVDVGAGIVAASSEEAEWRETALKAQRTLEALGA